MRSWLFQGSNQFLSPPVRMHGGLLCIVFCMYVCMSVTWPKFRLEVMSLAKNSFLEGIGSVSVTWPKFRLEVKSLDIDKKGFGAVRGCCLYVWDLTKIQARSQVPTVDKNSNRLMACGMWNLIIPFKNTLSPIFYCGSYTLLCFFSKFAIYSFPYGIIFSYTYYLRVSLKWRKCNLTLRWAHLPLYGT